MEIRRGREEIDRKVDMQGEGIKEVEGRERIGKKGKVRRGRRGKVEAGREKEEKAEVKRGKKGEIEVEKGKKDRKVDVERKNVDKKRKGRKGET